MTPQTMTAQSTKTDSLDSTVDDMRALSLRALARMFRGEDRMFVYTVRRRGDESVPEGISRRYTAMTLLGLAREAEPAAKQALGGDSVHGICGRLLEDVGTVANLGDVAMTLWVACVLKHDAAGRALDRMIELDPVRGSHPTVELAWCVTALSIDPAFCGADRSFVKSVAQRLMASFNSSSNLFPHWPVGADAPVLRSHIACFADLVYPTQALAHYHMASGDKQAIDQAGRCATRMCELQGPEGQWWWHFDSRTGRTVEGYPVYSVHQDAMAPMALFAVQDAGGEDFRSAIRRGLEWLVTPKEMAESLIDRSADLIWRKVARHEPNKLSRSVQALASRAHSSFRVPGLGMAFRPGAVDFECRPYHLGWLLYAWGNDRKVR